MPEAGTAAAKGVTAKAVAAAEPVETAMGKAAAMEMTTVAAIASVAIAAISITVIAAIIIIVVVMMTVGEREADNAERGCGDQRARAAAPMAMMAIAAPGDGLDSA